MDIIKIKNFHDFVETGCNYAVSAKNCSLSITGLRRQITSLEDEISVKLLHTEGKKIFLTKEGSVFFDNTKGLIFEYHKALESLHKRKDDKVLRIATTVAFGSLWLCGYLVNFIEKHKNLRISVVTSDEKPNLISDNIDVFIGSKIDDKNDFLIQELIDQYHMGLYASPKYIHEYGTPQSIEDLRYHKIISFGEVSTSPYANIDWHLELTNNITSHFSINTGAGVLRAVEMGFGIGVISSLAATLSEEKLIRILPEIERKNVDVFFVYPKYLKEDIIISDLKEALKRN